MVTWYSVGEGSARFNILPTTWIFHKRDTANQADQNIERNILFGNYTKKIYSHSSTNTSLRYIWFGHVNQHKKDIFTCVSSTGSLSAVGKVKNPKVLSGNDPLYLIPKITNCTLLFPSFLMFALFLSQTLDATQPTTFSTSEQKDFGREHRNVFLWIL